MVIAKMNVVLSKISALIITIFLSLSGFSQSCLPEGIVFSSQEQIDSFQVNYPNCTQIEGDVEIRDDSMNIANLNGLIGLTSIGGRLDIFDNNLLINLEGLNNLIEIGGDLTIGYNDTLADLTGLDSLTSIGGNLIIDRNDNLISLVGLGNLNSSSIENLGIFFNNSLSDCAIQSVCDYLTDINGTIDIFGNGIGCNNPSEIAKICGFTMPCLPYGNYFFYSQAEIDSFQINYPGCTELQGDVRIYSNVTNLDGLNAVTSIGKDLVISYLSINDLSGLDQVNLIGGYLRIAGNDLLKNLSGLGSLATIRGSLFIESNDLLINLAGLDEIDSIGEGFEIQHNRSLSNLTGLENLTSFEGYLYIYDNDNLNSLMGLNNLTSIGGYIWIRDNDALYNLSGLEALTSIGDEGISIMDNDTLNDLSGLENLTSVVGLINISSNKSLKSISGVENINPDLITELGIEDNDSLSTCEVQSICDYLADPYGNIYIYDNAPGCNSKEEVIAACLIGLDEPIKPESHINIYPNPASNIIMIELIQTTSINNTNLTIFNLNGKQLLSQQLSGPNTVIDIKTLPDGIYFLKLMDEGTVQMAKFVKLNH